MLIPLLVLGVGLVMMGVEVVRPGRSWPQVRGWWARAVLLNSVQGLMVLLAGVAWDGWMVRHRLWSADGLGVAGGALVGYLAITFVFYWGTVGVMSLRCCGAGFTKCTIARNVSRSLPAFTNTHWKFLPTAYCPALSSTSLSVLDRPPQHKPYYSAG